MSSHRNAQDTPEEELGLMALLYAGGCLDTDQAAGFEELMERNQAAREALAGAASQLFHRAGRSADLRPSGRYREVIRERLQMPHRCRPKVVRRRSRTPVLAMLGAAAAVLLILAVSYWSVPLEHAWVGAHAGRTDCIGPPPGAGKLMAVGVDVPRIQNGRLWREAAAKPNTPIPPGECAQPRRLLIVVFSDAWVVIRYQES